MDQVLWYVLAVVLVGGALFWFRHARAVVEERLRTVARRRGGRMGKAPWILYPRLVLELDGAQAQISCVHGSSQGGSNHTFAWVGCAGYPDISLDVRRMPDRVGLLERMGYERARSGDHAFDEGFWLHTGAAQPDTRAAQPGEWLLDQEVRAALLAFDARLRVRLRVGKSVAYRDGRLVLGEEELRLDVSINALPPLVEDVERLIDAAALAHARLMRRSPVGAVERSA